MTCWVLGRASTRIFYIRLFSPSSVLRLLNCLAFKFLCTKCRIRTITWMHLFVLICRLTITYRLIDILHQKLNAAFDFYLSRKKWTKISSEMWEQRVPAWQLPSQLSGGSCWVSTHRLPLSLYCDFTSPSSQDAPVITLSRKLIFIYIQKFLEREFSILFRVGWPFFYVWTNSTTAYANSS